MVEWNRGCFDPGKIYLSGQVLLGWEENSDGSFTVTSTGRTAGLKKRDDGSIVISCPDHDDSYWTEYFDLSTDYDKIESMAPQDIFLNEALAYGRGIRILKQDLWEALVSFIVSQNNNIPRITKSLKKIEEKAGGHKSGKGFPTPEELYEIRNSLCECGLGYRDMYLKKLAEEIHDGSRKLDFDKNTEKAYRQLLDITGIGPKVANCVLLFGLHRMERCPVDTWMKQVFANHYEGHQPEWTKSEYAGYYQQVTFFMERMSGGKQESRRGDLVT